MRRTHWDVEDYPLPGKEKKRGWVRRAASWAAAVLVVFAVMLALTLALRFGGEALVKAGANVGIPWPTIFLGLGSLFAAWVIVPCVRRGEGLLSIPLGSLSLGSLLIALGAYFDAAAEGSSLARGFVITGGIFVVLTMVSYASVSVYHRRQGQPLQWNEAKRHTSEYSTAQLLFLQMILAIGAVLTVLDGLLLWLLPYLPILIPAGLVLFFVGVSISVARKGFPLFAVPFGMLILSFLLVFAGIYFKFAGNTVFYAGFVIAAVVLFALMPVAVIAVNLYYHKQGKPVPTRYGDDSSPRFLIGFLIFYLVALAFCGTMILITSNKP